MIDSMPGSRVNCLTITPPARIRPRLINCSINFRNTWLIKVDMFKLIKFVIGRNIGGIMVSTDPSLQFIKPNLFALDSNIKTMINNLVDYRTVSPWPVLII